MSRVVNADLCCNSRGQEIEPNTKVWCPHVSLEMPAGFREVRVAEESLWADGKLVFNRSLAQVTLGTATASFNVGWHIVALPVINERPNDNPIQSVRDFLASMILLAPGSCPHDSREDRSRFLLLG